MSTDVEAAVQHKFRVTTYDCPVLMRQLQTEEEEGGGSHLGIRKQIDDIVQMHALFCILACDKARRLIPVDYTESFGEALVPMDRNTASTLNSAVETHRRHWWWASWLLHPSPFYT